MIPWQISGTSEMRRQCQRDGKKLRAMLRTSQETGHKTQDTAPSIIARLPCI